MIIGISSKFSGMGMFVSNFLALPNSGDEKSINDLGSIELNWS